MRHFPWRRRFLPLLGSVLLVLPFLGGCGPSEKDAAGVDYTPAPGGPWEVSTPQEQGLDSKSVARLFYQVGQMENMPARVQERVPGGRRRFQHRVGRTAGEHTFRHQEHQLRAGGDRPGAGLPDERGSEDEFAREHLFDPLGIQPGFWQQDWEGYYLGFSDLHLTATDLAKFGLLYRNDGKYQGKQIVPADWVRDSLKTYSEDAWKIRVGSNWKDNGYGQHRIEIMNTLAQAEKASALDAIRELLDTYFHEAEDSADEDGKFSLGFRATFNRSLSPTKLKVTCRLTKTTTDEPSGARSPAEGCPEGDAGPRRQIELTVNDPAQPVLGGLE